MYVNFINFIHRGLVKKKQRVIIYDTKWIQFKCISVKRLDGFTIPEGLGLYPINLYIN